MPNSIPSKLLAQVKTTDKKRFIQDYSEANYVLDVIKDAIQKEIEILLEDEEGDLIFNEPGYVSHYAYLMGKRKMARKILNLFPKKG